MHFLCDKNEKKGDESVEPIREKTLHLEKGLNWEEKKYAVEAAFIMGFQTEAAEFPITSYECGKAIPKTKEELASFWENPHEEVQIPEDYQSATAHAKQMPEFDWRKEKGLERLFLIGDFLKDENSDMLPDKLDFYFVLPENATDSMVAAACNLAFRFGMETTAFNGELVKKEYQGGNAFLFQEAQEIAIYLEKGEAQKVFFTGAGEELESFAAHLCGAFPWFDGFDSWVRILQDMTDSLAMKDKDGNLVYEKAFHGDPVKNYKESVKIYEKEYCIPWEVEHFHQIMEQEVYPKLMPGDKVKVQAALSEDKKVRTEVEREITNRIGKAQSEVEEITVLCAYKQGYSWLEEQVVPDLKGKNIGQLCIQFKPFLPEGVTDWKDENGATPSYNNTAQNTPDQWYDLPIRYLQELYPAVDMLEKTLGITKEQITFETYKGQEDLTYIVTVQDENGKEQYQNSYKARNSERPYLDRYPGMGKVHPSTGFLKVIVNGELLLEKAIQTDIEAVWDIYQKEILEDCRCFVEKETGGNVCIKEQPFFSQLRIDAALSEPDERLDSREDLISSLDALHEDIYFAGADYFKNYGMEKTGTMLEEPGLILPVIKKGTGKPYLKVTLFRQAAKGPELYIDGKHADILPSRNELSLYMEKMCWSKGKMQAVLRIKGVSQKVAEAYTDLLEKEALEMGERFTASRGKAGIDSLIFSLDQQEFEAVIPKGKKPEKNQNIEDVDILPDTLIGYEEYRNIIEKLKHVPGIQVYKTATSYQGREIYAVELLPDLKGYISRTKRITNHPSEIVNCRHHANEVSGTNAAFMLIKTLLTDAQYKDVAKKLNLVIVPMENTDGAAIHYELQKDNPYWKLHVARFNAVGKEFYYEHFKADTIHTEAMGLTRLFETFLPDVIVDNHGVPSHEWEQQFSGYTSPSFKGFWLPRSLLYGYFWYVTDEMFKSNYNVNKEMEDVVAEAIKAQPEMRALNKEWAEQFETYAHKWMPKLFPASYYKEMINYWIPFAADPAHRYPSIRFPWITTVAYTSEVADETAQGEYLNLCARAHLTHDLATIDMLMKAKSVYNTVLDITDGKIEVTCIRQRPMLV